MVLAYHAIWTTYGTWLPNDPRGSFSEKIYQEELAALGKIRHGRQDPQPDRRTLRCFWTAAEPRLSRPAVFLDPPGRQRIATAFAHVVKRLDLSVHACSIMNDHVHLVLLHNGRRVEYVVGQLKSAGTRAMGVKRTLWARGCWKVFLNKPAAVEAAVAYVEANPLQAGLGRQHWPFVIPLWCP